MYVRSLDLVLKGCRLQLEVREGERERERLLVVSGRKEGRDAGMLCPARYDLPT